MPLPLPLQPPESWGVWAHPSRKMHGREVTNSGPSPWGELWSSGASVDECLGVHHRCHGAQAFGGARLGGRRGKGAGRTQHHPCGEEVGQGSGLQGTRFGTQLCEP